VAPTADHGTALTPAGTLQLVSSTAPTMPMGWFAGPDASLAGTG
jgi:hypothetical protein